MDKIEILLKNLMLLATITLFMYGLIRGYDTLELSIHNLYFSSLILYLIKTNFLNQRRKGP